MLCYFPFCVRTSGGRSCRSSAGSYINAREGHRKHKTLYEQLPSCYYEDQPRNAVWDPLSQWPRPTIDREIRCRWEWINENILHNFAYSRVRADVGRNVQQPRFHGSDVWARRWTSARIHWPATFRVYRHLLDVDVHCQSKMWRASCHRWICFPTLCVRCAYRLPVHQPSQLGHLANAWRWQNIAVTTEMVAAADAVWQLKTNDILNGNCFFHIINNIISLSALNVTAILCLFITALCSKLHCKPWKLATSFSAITFVFIAQFL